MGYGALWRMDEQMKGAAPKQIMENIITVKVQTKQVMSIAIYIYTHTHILSCNADVLCDSYDSYKHRFCMILSMVYCTHTYGY